MSDVTEYQLAILMHATGWDTISPLHRNSFMPAASQLPDMQSLVAKGLMHLLHAPVPDVPIDNGTYAVTMAGIAYIVRSQQWANSALKLNRALTSKCLRLQRENEKYRRKLAKRRWLRTELQCDDGFGFGTLKFKSKLLINDVSIARMASYRKWEFACERVRDGGLRKFLKWQDCFCPIVDRAQDPDAVEVAACFAPSQKIDFSGIEELATKAGAQ